ncbi:MFS transporter [Allorhizobium taibaishanense]|uniref:Alpha-ketoglutarate transporter n=1 Tax=Allorhizobium taibaishanense TaxID=887144 RepID=A0A1Q9A301_9HYPH|nr:MFS transporter [Allorhizobium taibaishanense]MBB4005866.1 MHS family alpha-ketoglutarate permease-like MFS transporter [Allorhizobium taibaishanense]OLP48906.1 alpha-ketoglutarate transporter [Allorhizobium taibaishanense]
MANGQASNPPQEGTGDMARRLRSIFSGSIGNMVEYYDFYVYSAFSLYFAPSFFPNSNPTAQLLNTAGIFAVGFIMRPVGGWFFGAYADRRGRKSALTLSVLLMCFGSLMIAVTPGFATIGYAAPAVLMLARMLQGLSLGGEYGTSATYLSEMATKERRGFYSSFQYVTLISGQLCAILVLLLLQKLLLTPAELEAWGWRIPFVIGGGLAIIALFLRRNMAETEQFSRTAGKNLGSPLRELMKYPRQVVTVIGLTLGGTVAFYTYTTYMQKFLVNTVHLSKDDSTLVSAGALFVYMCLQPVVGWISDKIGRRPVLIAFGVLGSICTVPLLTTLSTASNAFEAFLIIIAALVIVSGYTAINAVVKAELFPTGVRALGVGLPYALTVSIFGGTAEYVALWFKEAGVEHWFYWYVSGCIAVSLVVYAVMPDTRQTSHIDRESE